MKFFFTTCPSWPLLLSSVVVTPTLIQEVESTAKNAPFSYDPNLENGPQHWGKLLIDDNTCDGPRNSPIAVATRSCDRWDDYQFNPGTCSTSQLEYTLTNAGTKASFPSEDCTNPSVIIPGLDNPYRALQLHIHAGSEHTIDGKFFGAELHIVHEEIGGDRFAVVGMMIEPGSDVENEFFQQLLDGWQREFDTVDDSCAVERATTGKRRRRDLEMVGDNTTGNRRLEAFSPYDLLPEGVTYYHYDGGLTTPPCLEVVWWNVADKPVLITPAQYQQLLQQILNFVDASTCNLGTNAGPRGITSRPVQALNGRLVERVCPVGFEEDKSCDESNDDTVDGEEVDSRSASAPMLAMRVMTSSVVVALVVMLSMM